jgi:hypothetical protein
VGKSSGAREFKGIAERLGAIAPIPLIRSILKQPGGLGLGPADQLWDSAMASDTIDLEKNRASAAAPFNTLVPFFIVTGIRFPHL